MDAARELAQLLKRARELVDELVQHLFLLGVAVRPRGLRAGSCRFAEYVELHPDGGGTLGPLAPFAQRSWGEVAGWFADPDGNLVALARSAS